MLNQLNKAKAKVTQLLEQCEDISQKYEALQDASHTKMYRLRKVGTSVVSRPTINHHSTCADVLQVVSTTARALDVTARTAIAMLRSSVRQIETNPSAMVLAQVRHPINFNHFYCGSLLPPVCCRC